MDTNIEHHVRQRAYELWQMTGMAEGRAHDHWIAAEREMLQKPLDPPTKAKAKARKPRTAKSKA